MSHTETGINVGSLPWQLGDERWRLVQRAMWRATRLEDGALAAAVTLIARRERKGVWLGFLAFCIMAAGTAVGLMGTVNAWSIGLLVLSLTGLGGTAVALRQLRRAEEIHADEADYQQLAALIGS